MLTEKEKSTSHELSMSLSGLWWEGYITVQDFSHLAKGEKVSVAELIQRLEHIFHVAYSSEVCKWDMRWSLVP